MAMLSEGHALNVPDLDSRGAKESDAEEIYAMNTIIFID
jgi:hypothetical protein